MSKKIEESEKPAVTGNQFMRSLSSGKKK